MLIVIADALLSPEQRAKFEPLAAKMIAPSRAEPGCLAYWYAFDLLEPMRLRVVEIWADAAALEFHFSTPHLKEFSQALRSLGPRDLKITVRELGAERKLPS